MLLNNSFVEEKITINDLTIALKIWGNTNSKPILCLHGKMDNAASFDLIAPLLSDHHLVAIDCPGTGLSSHYPESVLPYWKNDAFLILKLIELLKWKQFDIIAHSLGTLVATVLSLSKPNKIGKLIFIDTIGPTVKFYQNSLTYLQNSIEVFISNNQKPRTIFSDKESAIKDRMRIGNISYQAARVLVQRGMEKHNEGWIWTFDPRLECVTSMVPFEDEVNTMLSKISQPVFLLRASHGIPYPKEIFKLRSKSIKNLVIHHIDGGHHVHMDHPILVASLISRILNQT